MVFCLGGLIERLFGCFGDMSTVQLCQKSGAPEPRKKPKILAALDVLQRPMVMDQLSLQPR